MQVDLKTYDEQENEELMTKDELLFLINKKSPNKDKKDDVDFKLMLDIAADIYKRLQESIEPASFHYENYSDVFRFLNKKSKPFQSSIVNEMASRYFQKIKEKENKQYVEWDGKKNKLTYKELVSINVAFKTVSGHTYSSLLGLLKSKVYDNFGRDTLKALNYLKISNLKPDEKIDFTKCLDKEPELVQKIHKENEALFYPSVLKVGFTGLDQYKNFKEFLHKKGLMKQGWKNMCKQSKNFNLRAMRRPAVGIFALNNGLKDAWLRNNFVAAWLREPELKAKSNILIREINMYHGHVNKFSPFPVVKRYLDWNCRELEQIRDYLRATPEDNSKTLGQLYRKSVVWHEDIYKVKRAANKKFPEQKIESFKEDGYVFSHIKDAWGLYEEGEKMHHCVYSYSNTCANDTYVVYQVEYKVDSELDEEEKAKARKEKRDNERSTLGISVKKENVNDSDIFYRKYTFSQMSSYCNDRSSERMHKAAKEFLKELNKESKKEALEEYKAVNKKAKITKESLVEEYE